MNNFVPIGEAARALGASASALRRWETGRLVQARTKEGRRRYDLAALLPEQYNCALAHRRMGAYASVSNHDQKAGLERQKQVLELYYASQGWSFEVVSDLGYGKNYHKKGGLRRLSDVLIEGRVGRLVLTHKVRLLRLKQAVQEACSC